MVFSAQCHDSGETGIFALTLVVMKFFVPGTSTPEEAEQKYQKLAARYGAIPAPNNKRVAILQWKHHDEEFIAEVGKGIRSTEPLSTPDEPLVHVIYPGDPWVILSGSGRPGRNNPQLVGKREAKRAALFDNTETQA